MAPSLQRLDQISKPDDFDDQKTPIEIRDVEDNSVDFGEYNNGILSQIKRIIHGDSPGDWHADITSEFGIDASLKSLVAGVTRQTLVDDLTAKSFFIGITSVGALPNDAVWQIKKVVEDGDNIQYFFADGEEAFNKIWDDRNTYLYD